MALCWGLLARRFRERLPKHYRDKCVHVFNLAASATIFVKTATGWLRTTTNSDMEGVLVNSKISFQKI